MKTKKRQRLVAKKKRKRIKELYLSRNYCIIPGVNICSTSEEMLQAYYNSLPPQKREGKIHVDRWEQGKSKFGLGPDKMRNFKKLIVKPNGTGRIWLNDWKGHINLDFCGMLPRELVDYGAVMTVDKKGRKIFTMPKWWKRTKKTEFLSVFFYCTS